MGGIERAPGRYDFAAYDRLRDHLARAGVRPMFILDYGNRLYDHGQSPRSDSARAAFARFAAAAARHFRGQGVIWEIWNEPNIEQFWKPEPDAQAYARLALETARAVRTADPDAVILAPGSSELPWKFLETIFAAGLLEHIDAVSVHPYREQPPETAGHRLWTPPRLDRAVCLAGPAIAAHRLLGVGLFDGRGSRQRGQAGGLPVPAMAGKPRRGRERFHLLRLAR